MRRVIEGVRGTRGRRTYCIGPGWLYWMAGYSGCEPDAKSAPILRAFQLHEFVQLSV
jgi:hypothetical protein